VPPGGWPADVQKIILKGDKPIEGRPGASLAPADFAAVRQQLEAEIERKVSDDEVLSYLLYPEVFKQYNEKRRHYSDIGVLQTPVFFYGMQVGEETAIDIEAGKRLIVKFLAVGDPHSDGTRTIFFELNGQPRQVNVRDLSLKVEVREHPKAQTSDPNQIGAPTPGLITGLFVAAGDEVKRNDKLLSLEAMKMQSTIYAPKDGKIAKLLVEAGQQVEAKDLLLVIE
jgi:pyruvate carboxylase